MRPSSWKLIQSGNPLPRFIEKLAAAGGTRSNEARDRLDRLRLEHFLRQE